jgi:hypothetical protein
LIEKTRAWNRKKKSILKIIPSKMNRNQKKRD